MEELVDYFDKEDLLMEKAELNELLDEFEKIRYCEDW